MFKFIHAADIHLDSPMKSLGLEKGGLGTEEEIRLSTRTALEKLVDLAISEEVRFVLIAGDLYDGEWDHYGTGEFFASQVLKLNEAGIWTFIVSGNHDARSKISRELPIMNKAGFADKVFVFPDTAAATREIAELGVAVHGQSFGTGATEENLASWYPEPRPGMFNVGLLHTSAGGYEGHDPYAPCTVQQLAGKGYGYWALGHIHMGQILNAEGGPFMLADNQYEGDILERGVAPVVFSGNTQGRSVKELEAKGCLVVTVDNMKVTRIEHRPLDTVRWNICALDIGDVQDINDVYEQALNGLADIAAGCGDRIAAVRVTVTGKGPLHDKVTLDREELKSQLRSAAQKVGGGRIWFEKVVVNTEAPDRDSGLETEGNVPMELIERLDNLDISDAELREKILNDKSVKTFIRMIDLGETHLKSGDDGVLLKDQEKAAEYMDGMMKKAVQLLKAHLMKGEEQ